MISSRLFYLIGIWLILCLTLLFTCDVPKEIDYERYMSISQYMFDHQKYLLLHLGNALYTDKPPLLFWLIVLGWNLFGLHVLWPYMMLCLFSGGSVFLTYHIAKILYENNNPVEKAFKSAVILLTLTFFGVAVSELRVDVLLLFFSLLVHYGCLRVSGCSFFRPLGCATIFLGTALGLFSKGPLIFVVGLLPALLGLWAAKRKIFFKAIIISVLLGIISILFWFIPACIQGGEAYMQDMLFGQIAHRAVREKESIIFYLLRIPGYLFPFVFFPSVWKNLFKREKSTAVRYCLSGIIALTLIFSLFGQKAMHYLLPTMPFWAIFLANVKWYDRDRQILKILLIVFAFLGVFMLLWQTGKGLQFLEHLTQYSYNFYLVTQSFQSWQLVIFPVFSVIALFCLQKHLNTFLPMIVLLSLILQINIQIINRYYFQARFYMHLHQKIIKIEQEGNKMEMMLTKKDNKIFCDKKLLPDLPTSIIAQPGENSNYLLSNQHCLFFNSRYWNAQPVRLYIPRMPCAFGIWEMNENTKKLMKVCHTH